jgi:hypothetical protein
MNTLLTKSAPPGSSREVLANPAGVIGLDNISPGLSTGKGCIGGMRTYLQDLVKHLPGVLPGATIKLFTPRWSPRFDLPDNGHVRIVDCGDVPTSRAGRVWFEQAILPCVSAARPRSSCSPCSSSRIPTPFPASGAGICARSCRLRSAARPQSLRFPRHRKKK